MKDIEIQRFGSSNQIFTCGGNESGSAEALPSALRPELWRSLLSVGVIET
jgi:hypothetical protein